jgi:hypothetical protein
MQKVRKSMLSPVHWNAPSDWHCDNHGSSSILSEPVQCHLGEGAVPSCRTLTPSANPITTVTVALMLCGKHATELCGIIRSAGQD